MSDGNEDYDGEYDEENEEDELMRATENFDEMDEDYATTKESESLAKTKLSQKDYM